MYTVILAGGGGTRLQPLSTEEKPKQFLPLVNDKSLMQNTVERILHIDPEPENLAISTTLAYQDKTLQQLQSYGVDTVISEPERRNTAPAIAYIIKYIEDKKKAKVYPATGTSGAEDLILICPADHHITPVEKFASYIQEGSKYAQEGKIVLFGIKPDKPDTGYGYIKASGDDVALSIDQFVEKPDLATAEKYLTEGNYFWNAGIFLFSIATMKEELKTFAPKIYEHMKLPFDEFVAKFGELPKISIDYAVMEKTKKSILIPMDLQRSDLGNWDAVWEHGIKDDEGNLIIGDKRIKYPNVIIE